MSAGCSHGSQVAVSYNWVVDDDWKSLSRLDRWRFEISSNRQIIYKPSKSSRFVCELTKMKMRWWVHKHCLVFNLTHSITSANFSVYLFPTNRQHISLCHTGSGIVYSTSCIARQIWPCCHQQPFTYQRGTLWIKNTNIIFGDDTVPTRTT